MATMNQMPLPMGHPMYRMQHPAKVFKRQHSFSGFPAAPLSIINNNIDINSPEPPPEYHVKPRTNPLSLASSSAPPPNYVGPVSLPPYYPPVRPRPVGVFYSLPRHFSSGLSRHGMVPGYHHWAMPQPPPNHAHAQVRSVPHHHHIGGYLPPTSYPPVVSNRRPVSDGYYWMQRPIPAGYQSLPRRRFVMPPPPILGQPRTTRSGLLEERVPGDGAAGTQPKDCAYQPLPRRDGKREKGEKAEAKSIRVIDDKSEKRSESDSSSNSKRKSGKHRLPETSKKEAESKFSSPFFGKSAGKENSQTSKSADKENKNQSVSKPKEEGKYWKIYRREPTGPKVPTNTKPEGETSDGKLPLKQMLAEKMKFSTLPRRSEELRSRAELIRQVVPPSESKRVTSDNINITSPLAKLNECKVHESDGISSVELFYHPKSSHQRKASESDIKAPNSLLKTTKFIDSKYLSLPRKAVKNIESKYLSLPKRATKAEQSRSGAQKKIKEDKVISSRFSSKIEVRPPVENLLPPPPNFTQEDEDPLYARVIAPKGVSPSLDEGYCQLKEPPPPILESPVDPMYQSMSDSSTYSKPKPPLPVPSRYRRRNEDRPPPPLPPPRVNSELTTTGIFPPPPSLDTHTYPRHYRASYPGCLKGPDQERIPFRSSPCSVHPRLSDDEIYSSISSPVSSASSTPSTTLAGPRPLSRVPNSASWDPLESCSKGELSRTASTRQRRRRARSDPRMDADVLNRLAFSVWHTTLHGEKENSTDVAGTPKQGTISSRNTQSTARINNRNAPVTGARPGGVTAPPMDVVYVTERMISLSFPHCLDEASYSFHLREVALMLASKHGDNFKVFNLSPHGDVSHFLPRVIEVGWPEQLAPALEKICAVCKTLDAWINEPSQQHVAVLHSREGYEKIGVVVAAYMHYSNICASTDQALDRFSMKRFFDDKIKQLYHPSQRRYVQYFAGLLSGVIRINSSPLYLHTLTLYGIPHFEPRGGCHLFIKIYQGLTPIYTSGVYVLSETMRQATLVFEGGVQLRGDILLKAYHRRSLPAPSREVVFRTQFHTCVVSEKVLAFARHEMDDACNDMRFPLDGGIELYFTHSVEDRPHFAPNVSCDLSNGGHNVTCWDSYENLHLSFDPQDENNLTKEVSHTLGPLDGSLYATVIKKRPIGTPHSPLQRPTSPPTDSTPSPHAHSDTRYAPSIDSGIASSNSGGGAPVSPPTSDSSRASGDSRSTAAVTAPPRFGGVGGGLPRPPAHVDARQLDELLQGMLLDIENIPDLRPCQTPAPDIDSIRCPDFSVVTPKYDARRGTPARTPTTHQHVFSYNAPVSPMNGYNSAHDSALDSSLNTTCDDAPYHARVDSKPFSYAPYTSSPLLGRRRGTSECTPTAEPGTSATPTSPSIHRRSNRETLGNTRPGLESPRLVRKLSGQNGSAPERSPSPTTSPGGTLLRDRSQTLTTRLISGYDSSPYCTIRRNDKSADESLDLSRFKNSFDRSIGSDNLSFLQSKQRELADRREAKIRQERGPHEARMLSELRSRINQSQPRTTTPSSRDFEDGYVSDTTLFSETSRESSPVKTLSPLTINTSGAGASSPQKPPIGQSTKGGLSPTSPILASRSTLGREQQRTSTKYGQTSMTSNTSYTGRSLPRKFSDNAYDRERPFVAVKRAHETARGTDVTDSHSALTRLQSSPLGRINYSVYTAGNDSGLLTMVNQERSGPLPPSPGILRSPPHSSPLSSTPIPKSPSSYSDSNANDLRYSFSTRKPQSREDNSWLSDTEGTTSTSANRPNTPAFPPSTPSTPYLNPGLPPKSPPTLRTHLGLSSLSASSVTLPCRSAVKKSASLPSREMNPISIRSPSPASQTLRHELNGHASPAPSFYVGQSRRSSLTSLNETEVISSHPKFVKDISRFWYKPSISRDEAIVMLKDKNPGTFVVRDSNSFPGAFGLALKVSTPPPNIAAKSTDPASELVRHFLIEPTSRGVRLKGCVNEPTFGSLSALVYQHSITALALPCRLALPDHDPSGILGDTVDGTSHGTGANSALLQQGAACSVLYLFSVDTESLTGPQAVKRAVGTMLSGVASNTKNVTLRAVPTIVHFKVSSQGITLTDNERKLFFRRHYPVSSISHCGLDPEDRRWMHKSDDGTPLGSLRMFGFVAKKGASRTDNQCHICAELEPEQPAGAICNFVTKVMMTCVSRPHLV